MTKKQTSQGKSNIVIEFFNASIFVAKICRKYNVSPTMFQSWNEKFLQGDKQALADRGY